MNKYVVTIFAASLLLGANSSKIFANSENSGNVEEVEREDVTGDGQADIISVKESILRENNHNVVKEILQLDIAGVKQPVTVPLSAGEPWLLLTDLNYDGVKDILITIHSKEKQGDVKAYSYSFKNNKKKDLSAPPLVKTTGKLLENYKVELKLLNQVHIIDLKMSKKDLEKLGVYKNGQLQADGELSISDYLQLKPIITTTGKGMRGIQRVKGPIPNKSLGEIISVWYFREGAWMLQDIEYISNYKKIYHYIEMEG